MDILKRDHAPISQAAWAEIDQQAQQVILGNITARKFADFTGPLGWDFSAVNLGRLKVGKKAAGMSVEWGVREVQPIVEFRRHFTLNMFEIDNLTRGSQDADIEPLIEAAKEAARFEDTAIFQGFSQGGIEGIIKSSGHKAAKLPKAAEEYPKAVSQCVKAMHMANVGGPYLLILGPDEYFDLIQAGKGGFPPAKIIEEITGSQTVMCPSIKGGVLVSARGGDFELTVGKDFSIGYWNHSKHEVEFFITESFTFRVLEPAACGVLTAAAVK